MASVENLTILFTDIVGFSDLVANLPRKLSKNILEIHDRVLSGVIRRFGGRIVKSIGDSFLVTFRSPTDAVLCGMAMHDALWEAYQQTDTPNAVAIRVSLSAGEVRQTSHDVFGDAVNIASRLEEMTPANVVYLTEVVYLAMCKSEVKLERVGSFRFKNIPDETVIYQARPMPHAHDPAPLLAANEESYPYGGAHLHFLPAHKPSASFTKPVVLLCLSLLALFPMLWAASSSPEATVSGAEIDLAAIQGADNLTPIDPQNVAATLARGGIYDVAGEAEPDEEVEVKERDSTLRLQAEALPLLSSKDYLGLERLLADRQQEYKDTPYLQLLTAHTDVYFRRNISAITNYERAFGAMPSLAEEPLAIENMMILLGRESEAGRNLIARYLNGPLIEKLSVRTGQPGLTGRYDAFYLLKDSGHAEAIDRVGINIQDLRELDQCEQKKVAVMELKRLRDARALEALKEAISSGPFGIFKDRCLRKEAREAIALIEYKGGADEIVK